MGFKLATPSCRADAALDDGADEAPELPDLAVDVGRVAHDGARPPDDEVVRGDGDGGEASTMAMASILTWWRAGRQPPPSRKVRAAVAERLSSPVRLAAPMRALFLLAALAVLPVGAASYDPCATENALVDAPGWDVVLSMDASPCVGVESRGVGLTSGGCADVLWGADLGVLVAGGRDTCHAMAKADVDACDGQPILWTPYCALYGNEYWVCGKPAFEICIWGP